MRRMYGRSVSRDGIAGQNVCVTTGVSVREEGEVGVQDT